VTGARRPAAAGIDRGGFVDFRRCRRRLVVLLLFFCDRPLQGCLLAGVKAVGEH